MAPSDSTPADPRPVDDPATNPVPQEEAVQLPAEVAANGGNQPLTDVETRAQVLAALKEVAPDMEEAKLKPDVNFRDQFEFDSVDCLNFALALERTFTVHIPELDYPRLSSLDSATAYISGLIAR